MISWRNLGLQSRLVGLVVLCISVVVASLGYYVVASQQHILEDQMESTQRILREELGRKGIAVASTAALASGRALAVHDFLFVTEVMQAVREGDSQFVFGSLVSAEGRVLVHTDPTRAGQSLGAAEVETLAGINGPKVRDATWQGDSIMEVVAPLNVAGKRLGVVCLGLSLQQLNAETTRRKDALLEQMHTGVLTSVGIAVVLLVLGVGLATTSANALLRPMHNLLSAVQKLREGDLHSSVVVAGSPEFTQLGSAFNDMTLAVKQRENALHSALTEADEANRLKSEFLANISHELRTPLNAIINVPAALLEDFKPMKLWQCPSCSATFVPDDPEASEVGDKGDPCPDCGTPVSLVEQVVCTGNLAEHQRLNQRALASGQHLLRVVNDLLDFSRLQAGKLELFLEETPVQEMLTEITETVQGLAEAKDINLTTKLGGDRNGRLTLDRVKIAQVFINLLGNSIKFTPDGGTITLTFEPSYEGDTQRVHFTVRDSGIGIPPDKLGVIFEAFRQVDGSHTRTYGGTGLGLAITAQIVQLHGGKVWAESELGKGSLFHVVLPLQAPVTAVGDGAAPHKAAVQPVASANKRVLIIDDNRVYLDIAQQTMKKLGFGAEIASRPEHVVQVISETKPDLIILDVMMPRLSGIDVLRHLKESEATRSIPVLVSTAYSANEQIVTGLGGLWLPKPWTATELVACLKKHNLFQLGES